MSEPDTVPGYENAFYDALRKGQDDRAQRLLKQLPVDTFEQSHRQSMIKAAFEQNCPGTGQALIERGGTGLQWIDMIRDWALNGEFASITIVLNHLEPDPIERLESLHSAPVIVKDIARAAVESRIADHDEALSALLNTLDSIIEHSDHTAEDVIEYALNDPANWRWGGAEAGG